MFRRREKELVKANEINEGYGVPAGRKLVPIELTEAMKDALYRPYRLNVCLTPTKRRKSGHLPAQLRIHAMATGFL
jgi:hypothetical protein